MEAVPHSQRGSCCDNCFQSQDEDRRGKANLRPTIANRRVPARLDQGTLWAPAISMPRKKEDINGSYLGLPQLQPHPVVQHTAQDHRRNCKSCLSGSVQPSRPITLKRALPCKVHTPRFTTAFALLARAAHRGMSNRWRWNISG